MNPWQQALDYIDAWFWLKFPPKPITQLREAIAYAKERDKELRKQVVKLVAATQKAEAEHSRLIGEKAELETNPETPSDQLDRIEANIEMWGTHSVRLAEIAEAAREESRRIIEQLDRRVHTIRQLEGGVDEHRLCSLVDKARLSLSAPIATGIPPAADVEAAVRARYAAALQPQPDSGD